MGPSRNKGAVPFVTLNERSRPSQAARPSKAAKAKWKGNPFSMSDQNHAPADSVFDKLLKERILFLGDQVDDQIANKLCAQMLLLSAEDPTRDIALYINSPGGSVTAGMAIYDTMQYIRPDVSTICLGLAASMGAFLLLAGAPGKRYALPNAEVMLHQPWGGARGQASNIKIQADRILRDRERINRIISERTGQPLERVVRDTDRDFFLTAEQARKYGIIDRVIHAGRT